ncbi:alpha-L-rhamnosidase [Microbacterium marinilacus]|uniref:alpha-L-rhamnosidase n=1 Tax=Microbacterium marinilacus TaxID=415209 RepID=A0ABP7BJZ7_9MICO|nr:alpha-L-rhamnosidase [Microbacterium marinilacus]MBY0687677.1 glycoside hydrolase family 78 protein [Microbacterium marinilacus]
MIEPYRLRVEARVRPREVDVPHPVLSWAVRGDRDGQRPVAARVTLRRPGAQGVVWDSGVLPGEAVSATYDGPALAPDEAFSWRVEVEDDAGGRGQAESEFETGVGDWAGATWIGRDPEPNDAVDATDRDSDASVRPTLRTMNLEPPLQLRRAFELTGEPRRARLTLSARGLVVPYVNGERVGGDELLPGWTDYPSRIQYRTFDVTGLLRAGGNVLAAAVAEGWWSGFVGFDQRHHAHHYGTAPQLFARLLVDDEDGTRTVVATDGSWREHEGRRRWADLLMGEYLDDRFATPGWTGRGFDDARWRPAAVLDAEPGPLIGQRDEPVRVVDELAPVAVDRTSERTIVDFGQNLVGRLRVPASPDTPLRIRHGEVLQDGELYVENLRSAEATDLIRSSTPTEPLFTFHGFRYAELTGADVDASAVRAAVLSSDVEWTGSVTTSSPFLNRLIENIRWGQRGNFVSVPTDCPQRDERLGWTADVQVFAPTATLNADLQALLTRWLDDLVAAQLPNGSVPDVIPRSPGTTLFDYGAPGWGDAIVLVPWTLYRVYGDAAVLRRYLGPMLRWLDYVAARNPDGVWRTGRGNDYGDWLSVDEHTPKEVVATAYHAHATAVAAHIAGVLGNTSEADRLEARAAMIREAFAGEFLTADGRVHGDSQTGYLMTLAWDLAPDEARPALFARLVEKIEQRGARLTTGFHGVALLCPTLARFGRADLAYDLLFQREFPSWGFSIENGATTIWERWDGWTPEGGFQTPEMNSFNHYSLGSVGEWVYTDVAGIAQTDASIGFEDVVIAPRIDRRLEWVEGRLQTVRGEIRTRWARERDEIELTVSLPPGAGGVARLGGVERRLASGTSVLRVLATSV